MGIRGGYNRRIKKFKSTNSTKHTAFLNAQGGNNGRVENFNYTTSAIKHTATNDMTSLQDLLSWQTYINTAT